MLGTCCQITEEVMSLFKSLFSDCSDIPVERSSDKKRSVDDPAVASSTGFRNAENVEGSPDEHLEEQCSKRMEKEIPIFSRDYSNFFTVFSIY
ncbi:hypothetical protein NPIL_54501 [Nephila pilipes]|uniref:Uncharacterized protein n=1 Tax=Nephila pilipes TaxID=299642 RepID=A0A8X6QJT8_NEPPI|nr:hypothetical protein NPIL_54501 [Nephila pilipes]